MKIGFWELIVIVIVAFVFIGPDQLPVYAKKIGKMLRELNHWIRDYDYDNKAGRSFVIKVPNRDFRRAR